MKRPRGTGSLFVMSGPFEQRRPDEILWIRYCKNGRVYRESAHTTKIRDAEKLLAKRLGEAGNNTLISPSDRRLTVDQIYASLLNNYRTNEMGVLEGAEQRWRTRLQYHFGGIRVLDVTTDSLDRYVAWCREQGLSNATINRDIAALRRAFSLALKGKRVREIPSFPHLREAAPRSGFIAGPEYRKLKERATELWLRGLLATAYHFGFRKGELLNLRVRQVDLLNRTIRLNAGETKSGEGRLVPMTQDVFLLLQACCAGKDADCHVFTRQANKPVRRFSKSWTNLCESAGCPGLIFHDLRRSAVRNMIRRGIPERVAMAISGHKTRSVFDRYNIVSESDLRDAARKIESERSDVLAEFWQNEAERKPQSTSIPQQAVLPN